MIRTLILAAAGIGAMSSIGLADPIAGNWRTKSGETAAIAPCGADFCITLRTGEHKGRQIGRMTPGGGGNYSGELTVPSENKTYRGKGKLAGNMLTMSGCVMGGLICRGEDWTRQ